MKAEELRIGNLVMIGDIVMKVVGVISKRKSDDIALTDDNKVFLYREGSIIYDLWDNGRWNGQYVAELKGIPLTAEWLEKAGFELHCGSWQKGLTKIGELPDGEWMLDDYNYNYPTKIKYVHQLQNLKYALTGKELTITNPDK